MVTSKHAIGLFQKLRIVFKDQDAKEFVQDLEGAIDQRVEVFVKEETLTSSISGFKTEVIERISKVHTHILAWLFILIIGQTAGLVWLVLFLSK